MNIFSTSITLPQLFLATFLIAMVIGTAILIVYFLKKIKPRTRSTTPATLATPATPSGGWKSMVIPTIVILAVLGIAGYLLVTNWATVGKYMPGSTPEAPELSFGCGNSVEGSANTWVKIIGITEGGFDASQCFSSSLFTEGRNISLSVTGETVFVGNDKSSSKADADGASILADKRGRPTGDKLPLGAVVFTVDSKTLHLLGKEKYFQIKNSMLEVYDKKGGNLLESLAVNAQSPLKFNVNCAGKNADGTAICKAGYEIRLEFTK